MSPKKKAQYKEPPKKKASGPVIDDSTVELQAEKGALELLLPYLARGYSPVETSGAGAQCGVRALFSSWSSAVQEKGIQLYNGRIPRITEFKKLLKGQTYQRLCDEATKSAYPDAIPAKGTKARLDYDEIYRDTHRQSWLRMEGLQALLYAANEEYGSEFELAYVLEGFRGRFDNAGNWDAAFEQPTIVTSMVDNNHLNHPVIFLWNNNADTRNQSSGVEGAEGAEGSHWEGFGAPRDPPAVGDADRRQIVFDWNIGLELKADIENGVWRVIIDCKGAGVNDLSVRVGHFVRAAEPHNVKVPKGWVYMRLTTPTIAPSLVRVQLEGLVPRSSLERVEIHALAPAPGPLKTKKKRQYNFKRLTAREKQENRQKCIQDFGRFANISEEDATLWVTTFPDKSAAGLLDIYLDGNQLLFEIFPPGEPRDLEIFRVRAPNHSEQTRRRYLSAYRDLNTAVDKLIQDPSDIDNIKPLGGGSQKTLANFIVKTGATPEKAELFLSAFDTLDEAVESYIRDPNFFQDLNKGEPADLAGPTKKTGASAWLTETANAAWDFWHTLGEDEASLSKRNEGVTIKYPTLPPSPAGRDVIELKIFRETHKVLRGNVMVQVIGYVLDTSVGDTDAREFTTLDGNLTTSVLAEHPWGIKAERIPVFPEPIHLVAPSCGLLPSQLQRIRELTGYTKDQGLSLREYRKWAEKWRKEHIVSLPLGHVTREYKLTKDFRLEKGDVVRADAYSGKSDEHERLMVYTWSGKRARISYDDYEPIDCAFGISMWKTEVLDELRVELPVKRELLPDSPPNLTSLDKYGKKVGGSKRKSEDKDGGEPSKFRARSLPAKLPKGVENLQDKKRMGGKSRSAEPEADEEPSKKKRKGWLPRFT